jgi:tetratricopeptide (TPR) repeat protein
VAALAEQGRAAEALEHIAKAKEVSTKVNDLHRVEGVALCGMGQYAAALSAFQEGTRLFPNSIWGRVHEAWLLATAPDESLRDGRKAQELLQFLRTPLGTRADVWSFLMTEAVVAAENGQFNEAREFARRGDDAADTEFRRSIARRIRQVIDQDRPYRMPETGEIPPPPAFRARSN